MAHRDLMQSQTDREEKLGAVSDLELGPLLVSHVEAIQKERLAFWRDLRTATRTRVATCIRPFGMHSWNPRAETNAGRSIVMRSACMLPAVPMPMGIRLEEPSSGPRASAGTRSWAG